MYITFSLLHNKNIIQLLEVKQLLIKQFYPIQIE